MLLIRRREILVACAVLLADQLTKWWAIKSLEKNQVIEIIWTLQFRLVSNTGFAFSQGESLGPFIAVIVVFVLYFLLRLSKNSDSSLKKVSIGSVMGGATGNLLDRIVRSDDGFLRGAVVDFIDFQWWPVFNLADSAVVVGALGIIWTSLRNE